MLSTRASVGGLVLGLLLGTILHAGGLERMTAVQSVVQTIGNLWVDALVMTVIPLVVSQVVAAIVSAERTALGKMGAATLAAFVALLGVGAAYTIMLAPGIVSLFTVDPDTLASIQANVAIPATAAESAQQSQDLSGWLSNLIPRNPFQAATNGEILPLLVFAILFAIAVTRVTTERRRVVVLFVVGIAEAMLVLVRWILVLTPVGVFALAFTFAAHVGLEGAGILGFFVVVVSALLLGFTLLLYPMAALLGGVPIRQFARAVVRAQLIAVTTRSSLASLPSLFQGARFLRLPAVTTSVVLPLSVSTFKVNRTISSTVKLFFVAHLFGVPLGPAEIATFIVIVMVLSFTAVGIPGGGTAFKTLPAYLAAGLPIEGVVIFEAVDVIPDIFKTLVNVTGDLTVAAMMAHLFATPVPAGPVTEASTAAATAMPA